MLECSLNSRDRSLFRSKNCYSRRASHQETSFVIIAGYIMTVYTLGYHILGEGCENLISCLLAFPSLLSRAVNGNSLRSSSRQRTKPLSIIPANI